MPTVGLPSMHKEAGERRAFLPELVAFLHRLPAREIVLEEGYGAELGLDASTYRAASDRVRFASYDEVMAQDVVAVLRCPAEGELRKLRRGAVLLSMLHFPTRPGRVALLRELGIRGVSLDELVDDRGRRLVQNLEAVGWNGIRASFRELARLLPGFEDPTRPPVRVTVLGAGAVGAHAIRAAVRYGDPALRQRLLARGVPGVETTVVDFDLTGRPDYMSSLLARTDLLVDATQRPDPSRPVIPNEWIGKLPPHAVLLDLSVDPYDFSTDPPRLKGLEGIPEGNLDCFVFYPDDPAYERLDPRVKREHRRVALACYSWPGVEPWACMDIYGKQVEPIFRVLLERSLDELDPLHGAFFERAVARADVNRWQPRNTR